MALARTLAASGMARMTAATTTTTRAATRTATKAAAAREKHYLLNYEYVDGMLEKRGPYRSDHLAKAKEQHEKGIIKAAGAYGAAEGATFHFECDSEQVVEDFAKGDPYMKNGLIKSYKIHEWALVFPEQ